MTSEKIIGKGSYGVVTRNGSNVTKTCKLFSEDEDFYLDDNSIREAIFYQLVNKDNLNLLNLYSSNIPLTTINIVDNSIKYNMLYLGKTMSKYKHTNKAETISIFNKILKTLYYLHNKGFTHGDLKPDNILLDSEKNPYVIDYGSICYWHNKSMNNVYQRCTLYYVSPEELIDGYYSSKNDIWSLGIILFEWLTGFNFIDSLFKICDIPDKERLQFFEYNGKSPDGIMVPTTFLCNFYKNVSYDKIYECVKKYITDIDFVKIIGHCLLKDINIRCGVTKLLESTIFKQKINIITPRSSVDDDSYMSYCDEYRNNIHDMIWELCNTYTTILSPSIYGHSIMLYDRIILRLGNHKYNKSVLALCSIILSNIILKSNIIKVSTMIKIYSSNTFISEEINIKIIKSYFNIIFKNTYFLLFSKSADMYLIDENILINYETYRYICKRYILTSATVTFIIQKYKEHIE